ncbi:MAG: DAK2 domain-containing protein [Lachnospiraceae bacterium]|nr:DAK2 domain-containing protein [Lachnospiraceae bacterium]
MSLNTIDAQLLTKMFLAGAQNLEAKKEWINELNVFPVPDGDTGTNMSLTIMSAAREVTKLIDDDMETLAKAISSGSLRGARGNSGVILSQLFRGFCKVIRDHQKIDIEILTSALEKAVETAYKAVMKPKEGTILTVAREAAVKARDLQKNGASDMGAFLDEVIRHADFVLSQTPDMLPVLKQAGVVDSGGQGLMVIAKGAYDAFLGKELDFSLGEVTSGSSVDMKLDPQAAADIKYGYCTEFIILLNKTFNIKHEMDFKAYLESIGDSIVVVADDDIVKVHVHTNDPGMAIQRALMYGALSNMKIDNMRLEHQEKLFKMSQSSQKKEEKTQTPTSRPAVTELKETGFISVAAGEGMEEIFRGLGVDFVISGGQTMNPSTEDMLNAIEQVAAKNIFIFPNNKNIILAADQAKRMTKDKKIIVIPSKTIPQGITAIINYIPDLGIEENESIMLDEMKNVGTGQITYAVRDTDIDGRAIKQGDYIGLGDSGILAVGSGMEETALAMAEAMMEEEKELISIYYGADVKEKDAEALADKIRERYSGCDVELQYGGQPVYYYIVSVE